jgi:cell wall-associated NlpC family hydrolase
MPINGVALGALAVGSVFVYSAIKGKSILATAQAVITGTNPSTVPPSTQITSNSPADTSAGGSTTSMGNVTGIAAIADSYIGKLQYVFGGPPPIGTVDCSSFASKVLAQAGIQNPGGAPYSPNTHGPTTLSYIAWSGAKTVGHTADVSIPGDLIVWQTHMGIAVGNGQYVSAHDPAEGVSAKPISFPGEFLFVRRLNT